MKFIINTDLNLITRASKSFNEWSENVKTKFLKSITTFLDKNNIKHELLENFARNYILKHTNLSEYETDCMWMSYRYCIGRHTIASHMHAHDIWINCKGRITSKERELFNAFDINREIEQHLNFINPNFYFPITSLNRIYTPALDIVFEFIEDYNIKSKKDLLKYKDVHVILADNERGYKIETVTWEEYLRTKVTKFIQAIDNTHDEDYCWEMFTDWKEKTNKFQLDEKTKNYFEELTKHMPNPEYYWINDIEDLMVWNDLVHCFDYEHHHKSILKDGTECLWFWSWTNKSEQREDGYYYKTFGYKKIRVPLDKWNDSVTTWIPDESIKENIY